MLLTESAKLRNPRVTSFLHTLPVYRSWFSRGRSMKWHTCAPHLTAFTSPWVTKTAASASSACSMVKATSPSTATRMPSQPSSTTPSVPVSWPGQGWVSASLWLFPGWLVLLTTVQNTVIVSMYQQVNHHYSTLCFSVAGHGCDCMGCDQRVWPVQTEGSQGCHLTSAVSQGEKPAGLQVLSRKYNLIQTVVHYTCIPWYWNCWVEMIRFSLLCCPPGMCNSWKFSLDRWSAFGSTCFYLAF